MTIVIAQTDIDAQLIRIKNLRQTIAETRGAIAPLETNLTETYDEFQAVVGSLRRQFMRVQSEIAVLKGQIESFEQDFEDNFTPSSENLATLEDESDRHNEISLDPEAVEKDVLLEHLFRVLDPMTNDEDGELLSTLQGLCQDPSVSLANVLEELPWGMVWIQRSPQEGLIDQHHRLSSWERVLAKYLETLNRTGDRLLHDSRYGLWQQRQHGTEHWQNFLEQYAQQQRDQNAELQAELEKLQQEWTRLTKAKRSV